MKPNEPNNGPQPSTPVRVGIYLHPGDLDQSLQAQKDEATQYAEQLVGPDTQIGSVDYYADLGRSGLDEDRPELNRLLADVRTGHLDLVLMCSGNRISRIWVGLVEFKHVLEHFQFLPGMARAYPEFWK